jgi:hypothetical protein
MSLQVDQGGMTWSDPSSRLCWKGFQGSDDTVLRSLYFSGNCFSPFRQWDTDLERSETSAHRGACERGDAASEKRPQWSF